MRTLHELGLKKQYIFEMRTLHELGLKFVRDLLDFFLVCHVLQSQLVLVLQRQLIHLGLCGTKQDTLGESRSTHPP